MPRILIADDHALFRHGIRSLIESNGDEFEVIGEAQDGLEVVAKVVDLQPDTVLIDLRMPNQNGVESIEAIKQRAPQTNVIVVTGHCTEEHVRAALEAGADGYVLKEDSGEDLIKALRASQEGKVFLSPGICGPLISGYLRAPSPREPQTGVAPERPGPAQTSWSKLTSRERQMLKLVAEGKKNREIAALLSLSAKTVEKHRANLMRKMGFGSVSELVAYAIERGLV
jgi:DNA-binding NarL/FixJ family response regulator